MKQTFWLMIDDALNLYSDAACCESCMFGHLLQEWCNLYSGDLAKGRELKYRATLGLY